MNEAEKEQTKLFAKALDRASPACLAVGVLTPMGALFFGQPAGIMAPLPPIRLGIVAWLVCAWLFALGSLVTIGAVETPAYRAPENSQKSSVQQGDKSHDACVARRQREGLNIRFAAFRCVNPNN